jgi:hypothetical protein
MKRIYRALILSVSLVGSSMAFAQQPVQPLTNASVIKLVKAGFKEKTLVAIIRSRPSQFDLSPDRLIELKRSGVSERVITAMLAMASGTNIVLDDPDEEAFFGTTKNNDPGASDGQSGFDIFGSSSGSRAHSRNRGPDGSSENDSATTGSATVKILRPPSESNEPPKLEKTPTLTNESIVDLVDAGFSEGTIVRRIEQSPANFDLSPEKLADLKRKRVSDRIIAAMTAAMGEDSPTRATKAGSDN